MKKTNFLEVKKLVENKFNTSELEPLKFYDISDLSIEIDSPDGWAKAVSFVVKPGYRSVVELSDGSKIHCSDSHRLTTLSGSFKVSDLRLGEDVVTKSGSSEIVKIDISEDKEMFYDIEVDSEDHLYYTADGVCHHNTGKTFTVEKILHSVGLRDGEGYFKNTGSSSAAGIYGTLYRYRDQIVFFDDSDDSLKDQTSRNIFKAATDTKPIRKLVWNKAGGNVVDPDEFDEEDLKAGKVPRYFEFTGKVIFISNLTMNKLDPDGALRTRAFIIEIDPTDEEIYDFMEKIIDEIKLEGGLSLATKQRLKVVELIRKGESKQRPNLRILVRGLNMAAGAEVAGVSISDKDLSRMIATYA